MGTNTDKDPDFTDEFCGFLQRSVTGVDAAEVLLLMRDNAERWWTAHELSEQLAPAAIVAEADVQRHLDTLQHYGIIVRDASRRARYHSGAAHDGFVTTLARLYVQRPVTLFRTIYALRDTKINTFADAFKLRR